MPFSFPEIPFRLNVGIEVKCDPFRIIRSSYFSDYDYVVSAVSVEDIEKRKNYLLTQSSPIFIDDYYLVTSAIFRMQFCGKLHDNDLADCENNYQLIKMDLDYCNHIATRGVNIYFNYRQYSKENFSKNLFFFCQIIKRHIKENPDQIINIEVDFDTNSFDTYRKILTSLDDMLNMNMILRINKDLPNNYNQLLKEIIANNVINFIIPVSLFITNKNGYPVLSKVHQEIAKELFKYKIDLIIKDDLDLTSSKGLSALNDYYIYMAYLFKNHCSYPSKFDKIKVNYYDNLQTPLQPLKDNLQSQVYETFEQDCTKYMLYTLAITKAVDDLCLSYQAEKEHIISIGIFGGGRGPLVRSALGAIKNHPEREFFIFCVEKNLNAFNTLLTLAKNEPESFSKVKFIYCDMRNFEVPKEISSIDICISELLGSFGDNELSPECLYSIKKYMNQERGIMIPSEYTSFIEPVYCPRSWHNIKVVNDSYNSQFIILFHRAYFPFEESKECFKFKHYINEEDSEFNQFRSVFFVRREDCIITGFAGYFKAILYKDVVMSICPWDHTEDLFSWFPIYFPTSSQIPVKGNIGVTINIKRCNDGKKVWYEWNVDNGDFLNYTGRIHNSNGEGFSILL